MRARARTQGGLGILAAIICVAVLVTLLASMTAYLAGFALTSSRCAQAVRARALAEAGVESAFARLASGRGRAGEPLRFELDRGSCLVTLSPAPNDPDRWTVVSEGDLKLAGGHMSCRVTLVVQTPAAGTSVRILSREETTRYLRSEPERKTKKEDRTG